MVRTLPRDVLQVLHRAWRNPFTTKSDYARTEAPLIALAASEGLITTRTLHTNPDAWGPSWRITSKGLRLLERTIPK